MWCEIKVIKGRRYRYESWRENGKKRSRYIGPEHSTREGTPSAATAGAKNHPQGNAPLPKTAHRPPISAERIGPTIVQVGQSVVMIAGPDADDVAQFIYERCQ